jgi:hypothetical protein
LAREKIGSKYRKCPFKNLDGKLIIRKLSPINKASIGERKI